MGADHAFDGHDGAGANAADAPAGEEDDGDAAGVVDEHDFERRAVGPRSDADGPHTAANVRFGQDANPGASLLLSYLISQAYIPEFQVRFRWKPNSVAMWDNRSTQHYAVMDYPPCHRKMERAGIIGDKPF